MLWEELEFTATNGVIKKHVNRSVTNIFKPNYSKYIEIGTIKDKLYEFLIGKQKGSSVCITLWGHGGNGKTATVQKICEELAYKKDRPFEFIFFLTAKDRELNKYTGKIEHINVENRITTFDELIRSLSLFLYNESSVHYERIVNDTSKMLIVIDDFETFEDEEKTKITNFIKLLNTNYHKVIITTRNSFLKVGDEIQTNELNQSDTVQFLIEVLETEHGFTKTRLKEIREIITQGHWSEDIHTITLGKPLEIIRFINCFVQKGSLSTEFMKEIENLNNLSDRNEFLYGRNYQQLSNDKLAQDIFVVVGLLTPQESLTSLVSHIKHILNIKEDDESKFNQSIDKLAKLKLIDLDETGAYKVDSKDILDIMKSEYDKRSNIFKRNTKRNYDKIKQNITTETDRALLNHAKSLRHQSNPDYTITQYREILNKGKDFSYSIKREALLDLADFLFNLRGQKEDAVELLDSYFNEFYEFSVLKRYTSYAWSVDREKAIRVLEEFSSKYTSKKETLSKSQRTHLQGLIVMREGFFWNDQYDRYPEDREEIKGQLNRIYREFGHILYTELQRSDLSKNFTSEELNDISLAMETLVDCCYRTDKTNIAIEVCKFALENFPPHFKMKFRKKMDRISGFSAQYLHSEPKRVSSDYYPKPIPVGSLPIINLSFANSGYSGSIIRLYRDESPRYGYIRVSMPKIKGRVYFRETGVKNGAFNGLSLGDKVTFGFGTATKYKYGAINIKKVD